MQYLKVGPVRIPYMIKMEGEKKSFQMLGVKIPFSTVIRNNRKYYKIFFLTLRLPFLDKYFITQGYSNYLQRNELTEEKIRNIAVQIFQEKLGYSPNLDNPRSMNEKIFWLKLNYHDPMVTKCCDKFSVKEYVTEVLGPGYVVPTLHSWECAENVDFSVLPEKYVLKVNWSSGYNIIVRDRDAVNEQEVRRQIAHWMQPQQNSYYQTFNWGYKHMKPVVYAEQYMEQMRGQLYDYKFFCCNGKVKFWFIATERYSEKNNLTHDFYDMNFNKLEFDYGGRSHSDHPQEKPQFFDRMVEYAERLAKPFPFVRVDFYETGERLYVGEMTFYPGGGILAFDPVEWDYRLGSYIELPKKC